MESARIISVVPFLIAIGCGTTMSQKKSIHELMGGDSLVVQVRPIDARIREKYGPRFEEMGHVAQVTLKGRTFLDNEGLIDEMGIKLPLGPLGYEDAKVGETFVKPAVGELVKVREKRYSFYKQYELAKPHRAQVTQDAEGVHFKMEVKHPRWAYTYRKTFRVLPEKPVLVLEYELRNDGNDTLRTEQYNHNWFAFADSTSPEAYQVQTRFVPVYEGESPLSFSLGKVSVPTDLAKPTFMDFSTIEAPRQNRLTLEHKSSRMRVDIAGNFPVSHFAIYGEGNRVCPEVFILLEVAPGETRKWNRRYSFRVDGP